MSSHADAVSAMTRSYTAVDSPETHRVDGAYRRLNRRAQFARQSLGVRLHARLQRCVTVKLNNLSKPANPTLPTADVRSANGVCPPPRCPRR